MEGVPRLSMLSFELKSSSDQVDFTTPLKSYITEFYSENAELYTKECFELEQLRKLAVSTSLDFVGCSNLKKHYCQIEFLLSRFTLKDGGPMLIPFTWEDLMGQQMVTFPDIMFEQANILYNIGSLHSKLGSMDNRMTPEGMKVSCTHFQCAAWAFQYLRDSFDSYACTDFNKDLLSFMSTTMLAQAQECILEKSMTDNRKSSITAKVSAQIVHYYELAMKHLGSFVSKTSINTKLTKEWKKRLDIKMGFYQCITYYYMGLNAEEQSKWGERLTYFSSAMTDLEDLMKINKLDDTLVDESLKFMIDVIGGKYNSAKKDNDFIYHDKVPNLDSLPEIKGASLVKGIPLNANDPEVSGRDIFKKLVPYKIHEQSSLYSEEKAKLLRKVGTEVEEKNAELKNFLSLLQLNPSDTILPESIKIPDILLEKCAAVSVRPNAIKDLVRAMQALSGRSTDVEGDLNAAVKIIDFIEKNIQEISETHGIKLDGLKECDEIRKECSKYMDTLKNTSQLNEELHRLMEVHISNLKILSSPVQDIHAAISSFQYKPSESELEVLRDMVKLMEKVDHMSRQRNQLLEQLREQIKKDDITQKLVVAPESINHEDYFKEQLEKHNQQVNLIKQNLMAQANILHALTETNAKYVGIRKNITESSRRQQDFISAVIKSYEVYEDLLSKTMQGVDFYDKLSSHVSNVLNKAENLLTSHKTKEARIKETTTVPQTKDSLPVIVSNSTDSIMDPHSFSTSHLSNLKPSLKEIPRTNLRLKDYLPFMKPGTFGQKSGQFHSSHDNLGYQPVNTTLMSTVPLNSTSLPSSHTSSPLHIPRSDLNIVLSSQMNYSLNPSITSSLDILNASIPSNNFMSSLPMSRLPPQALSFQNSVRGHLASQDQPGIQTLLKFPGYNSPSSSNLASSSQSIACEQTSNPMSSIYTSLHTESFPPIFEAKTHSLLQPHIQHSTLTFPSSLQNNISSFQTLKQSMNHFPAQSGMNATSILSHPMALLTAQPSVSCNMSSLSQQVEPQSQQLHQIQQSQGFKPFLTSYNLPQFQSIQQVQQPHQHIGQSQGIQQTQQLQLLPKLQNLSLSQSIQQPQHFQQPQLLHNSQQFSQGYELHLQPQQHLQHTQVNNQIQQLQNTELFQKPRTPQSNQLQYPQQLYNLQHPSSTRLQSAQPSIQLQPQQLLPINVAQSQQPLQINFTVPLAQQQFMTQSPQQHFLSQSQGMSDDSRYHQVPTSQCQMNASGANPASASVFSVKSLPQAQLPVISNNNASTSNSFYQSSLSQNEHIRKSSLASLDEMLSTGSNISQESSVLIPKIITDEDLKRQQNEEAKKSLKLNNKDPYLDPEVLNKFIVEVEEYEKHVETLCKPTSNKLTILEKEWRELNEMQERSTGSFSIAIARCYPLKNRFPDVMPFDNSRVKLLGSSDDYINASLIKSMSLACPDIIATQSPLPITFADFWQMVYDYNVEIIVMLCSENEVSSKVYWPTDKGQKTTIAGNFAITLHSVQTRPGWTERTISVTHSKSHISRSVIHLQFHLWPPGAEPESCDSLLEFISHVHGLYLQQRSLTKPIVIHCSNGIGRTGTFAVIYTGVEGINKGTGIINSCETINQMRTQRKFFVEFERQFKFIYKTILVHAQNMLKNHGVLNSTPISEKSTLHGYRENRYNKAHTKDTFNFDLNEICASNAGTQSTLSHDGEATSRNQQTLQQPQLPVQPSQQITSMSNEPSSTKSSCITDIQNPDKFTLDIKTSRRKITKANFFSQAGSLSGKPSSGTDQLDPLNELDPLWTLKK